MLAQTDTEEQVRNAWQVNTKCIRWTLMVMKNGDGMLTAGRFPCHMGSPFILNNFETSHPLDSNMKIKTILTASHSDVN